jgi:hypothetical protein
MAEGYKPSPSFVSRKKTFINILLPILKYHFFNRFFLLEFFTGTTFHVRVPLMTLNIRG